MVAGVDQGTTVTPPAGLPTLAATNIVTVQNIIPPDSYVNSAATCNIWRNGGGRRKR